MSYLSTVQEYMVENFLFGERERLQEDTSFLESGIIDSTGILELVTFLEESFDIVIEDEELIPENLDSLKNITQFLDKKLNGNSGHMNLL